MVKGIIFEPEGILFESGPILRDARVAAALALGVTCDPDIIEQAEDSTINFDYGVGPEIRDAIQSQAFNLIHSEPCQFIKPDVDVQALFLTLRSYGLKIGVCAKASESIVKPLLEAGGYSPWIDAEVYGDNGYQPKPSPAQMFECARRLDLPMEQCCIVECTSVGLEAGLQTGCFRLLKVRNPESFHLSLFQSFLDPENLGRMTA